MADNKETMGDTIPEKEGALHSEKVVVGETAAENHHYEHFANASPEWRNAFEKTLMRKVDMRLVPLLIVSAQPTHRSKHWRLPPDVARGL